MPRRLSRIITSRNNHGIKIHHFEHSRRFPPIDFNRKITTHIEAKKMRGCAQTRERLKISLFFTSSSPRYRRANDFLCIHQLRPWFPLLAAYNLLLSTLISIMFPMPFSLRTHTYGARILRVIFPMPRACATSDPRTILKVAHRAVYGQVETRLQIFNYLGKDRARGGESEGEQGSGEERGEKKKVVGSALMRRRIVTRAPP